MKDFNNKRFLIPVALVLGAFALRLYAALVPGIIVPDGVVYIDTAKMILSGQWQKVSEQGIYSAYPFLIVLFQKMFVDWETAGRMVSVVFGSLAVLPFYFLIKRIFDIKIAVIASLFFVINPRLVEYSSNVIREGAFWFFSITALWAAHEGICRKKWILMVCASFFVGLAALTRMEGVGLAAIIILWICWYYWKEKKFGIKKTLLLLLVFVFAFPVIFSAPLIILKARRGQWEIGHLGSKIPYVLKQSEKDAAASYKMSVDESDTVAKFLSGNKYAYFLWKALHKFFRSFHVLFILFFIIGVVRRKVIPYDSREVPIIIWWAVFFLVSLLYVSKIYYLSTRHGMLMSIPATLWVSIGFIELNNMIERFVARSRPAWNYARNGLVYLFIPTCLIILPNTLSWSGHDKVEMKKAGIYLKKMGYSKEKIAVEPRLIRLGFYADTNYVVIPPLMDHVKLNSFLHSEHITHLVVDERTVDGTIKGFKDNLKSFNIEKMNLPELDTYKEYSIVVFKAIRK